MKQALSQNSATGKEEVDVSEEQQDSVEAQSQTEPEVSASQPDVAEQPSVVKEESAVPPTRTVRKKRKKKDAPVSEEEISPRPSIWPILLAFAIAFLLFGVVTHPIILTVGVVLIIGTIIGWTLERR